MADNSAEINYYTDSINYMWSPTKNQFDGKEATVAELESVLEKPWLEAMKKDPKKTSQQAYDEVISKLPKGATEKKLLEDFKTVFGKPLDPPNKYTQNMLEADIGKLKKKVREFLAYGMFCDDQIRYAQQRIDQLNKQGGDPMYGESPDAGNSDTEY